MSGADFGLRLRKLISMGKLNIMGKLSDIVVPIVKIRFGSQKNKKKGAKRMKKIFSFIVCCLLFSGISYAESWHNTNSIRVGWDAVTKTLETDIIKYQLYLKPVNATGIVSAFGNEITETEAIVQFASEGKYYIGVETVRYPEGGTVAVKSETISWSNDATVCGPDGAFGVIYYVSPRNVIGIKIIK